MPTIQSGRIQSGTGQVSFVTNQTAGSASGGGSGGTSFTFSVVNAGSGIALYNSLAQSGNSVVLTLRIWSVATMSASPGQWRDHDHRQHGSRANRPYGTVWGRRGRPDRRHGCNRSQRFYRPHRPHRLDWIAGRNWPHWHSVANHILCRLQFFVEHCRIIDKLCANGAR